MIACSSGLGTYSQPLGRGQSLRNHNKRGLQGVTYLSIINFASAEKRVQGVVAGNDEPSEVHEEFAGDVEEDEEEIDPNKAKEGIDLRYGCLLLEIVQGGIFG